MLDFVKRRLAKFNIDLVSCIALDDCRIKRPHLLEKTGIGGSVIIFAVPYLSREAAGTRNISSYAVSRDYHIFFASLFDEVIRALKNDYPDNRFAGFTDHSPIDEIEAAAKAGLGVIGENHLLITEKYSSYVFLGEIITDASLPYASGEARSCIKCGRCLKACPVGCNSEKCLSALTQKKGELNEDEKSAIKVSGCAWGCDICQQVCPYTLKAENEGTIYTNTRFFNEHLTPLLTSEEVKNMSDSDFKERAYSWRGKQTVIRNLEILEGKEDTP